jgi:hypothetical protein
LFKSIASFGSASQSPLPTYATLLAGSGVA